MRQLACQCPAHPPSLFAAALRDLMAARVDELLAFYGIQAAGPVCERRRALARAIGQLSV